ALGVDVGLGLDAAEAQRESVRDRPHLHRHLVAVDAAAPQRIARLPVRRHQPRILFAGEVYGNRPALALDDEAVLVGAEPDRTGAVAHHVTAVHLSRDLPLTLTEHVIDCRRHRRDHGGALTV